jgi:hypothetical protein
MERASELAEGRVPGEGEEDAGEDEQHGREDREREQEDGAEDREHGREDRKLGAEDGRADGSSRCDASEVPVPPPGDEEVIASLGGRGRVGGLGSGVGDEMIAQQLVRWVVSGRCSASLTELSR